MQEKNHLNEVLGYCGIHCGGCALGNGAMASRAQTVAGHVRDYKLADWAHFVPGGSGIDFPAVIKGLEWIAGNASCPGCIGGGGSPDCAIRACAREKGFQLCAQCDEMEACPRFDFLISDDFNPKEFCRAIKSMGKEAYLERINAKRA